MREAEIKDAVSYLRIINQKFDDLALERVIGSPKKGIGESTLNQIYTFGKLNKLCLEDYIIKILEKGGFKPKIKSVLNLFNCNDTEMASGCSQNETF